MQLTAQEETLPETQFLPSKRVTLDSSVVSDAQQLDRAEISNAAL
jgi:hypothetical protein